jgi:hypothetical protein
MTANNQLKTRRQVSLGGAGANGCVTTAVLIVAPSYSIVLWFTQPPRRSINNSTGWLASIGTLYSRFAPPMKPRAPGNDSPSRTAPGLTSADDGSKHGFVALSPAKRRDATTIMDSAASFEDAFLWPSDLDVAVGL